ncbi:unnamed protein product [Mytilus coruscus]|uniref:SWIM-type domain-containing protein n=1 Tax=Mytilus coruscus TaxID=42192 RepID=A0A6J8ACJ0_MYTCO|nr:unnamed protein product [Mytilus coruscus]
MPKLSREQIEAYFLYKMAEDNVTYNYRLKLEKSSGDPLNSHCECPAGRGPHGSCKDVAAVLIMISEFITTGNVNIERSCTDTLMMFTKPKSSYSVSPVKAEKLPTKRKLAPVYLADPRPMKYRNCTGYNDHIKNTVTNFCSVSSMDLSMRYLYEKANIQTPSTSDMGLFEGISKFALVSAILTAVGFLVHLIGYGAPYWVKSKIYHSGLWKSCVSSICGTMLVVHSFQHGSRQPKPSRHLPF